VSTPRLPSRVTVPAAIIDAGPTELRGQQRLALIDVRYTYPRGPQVLKGVTAHCQAGQVCCVVGANGCGKTTLMRIAGGLLTPTGGVVARAGTRPGSSAMLARAVIGEEPGDDSTLLRRRVSSAWTKAVIEALNVGPTTRRPREHLSRGQRHGLALAEALLPRPDVLLIDDPFTDLDPVGRAGLLDLLARLRNRGAAILLATDDVLLACRAADRVAILADGVLEWDHPDDVLLDDHRARTAGLRPAPRTAATQSQTRIHPPSDTGSHASRLAAVVRDRLALDRDARVLLQQARTAGHHYPLPATVVSVDQPNARTWLFACPLCELSPHQLAKALLVDPEGHTHVTSH
jgi:ABC-type multidrug transport system ATPase subunit